MSNKTKNIILISSIVLAVVLIISGVTYAWYVWSTDETNQTVIVTDVGNAYVYYDAGSDIAGASLKPVESHTFGIVKTINVKSDVNSGVLLNLYLDITTLDEELKHESFKYAVYKAGRSVPLAEGNFSETFLNENLVGNCSNTGGNHLVLLKDEEVNTIVSTYLLYIWIDGNMDNPITMQSKQFSFNIHADGSNALLNEGTVDLEGTITFNLMNIYDNSAKTEVTNGGMTYYYDTTNNLMLDYDDNLRYYGADPNNYIYFNCDDYYNQTSDTCELWRIIGVFDDKVKIIRNDMLSGLYSWDFNYNDDFTSVTASNSWHDSSLNKLLNESYYNNQDIVYYSYSNTQTIRTTNANFYSNNEGIKNDETRNIIEDAVWNLGGYSSATLYSNTMYDYERGTLKCSSCTYDTTWIGKIALMYPTDYGYATDFTSCSQTLNLYNSETDSYACRSNNWLYNSSAVQCTLTPTSSTNRAVWAITDVGAVSYWATVDINIFSIKPTLYLKPNTIMGTEGDGTIENPYRIAL